MIRILLVDDQKSIRERLKSLLETEPDFDIVGMVDNGDDAIEQVKLLIPDVVLIDMEMPGSRWCLGYQNHFPQFAKNQNFSTQQSRSQ